MVMRVSGTEETLFLFPLHVVLFPGELLPLRIFEERYRQMISRCLGSGESFGVVLIKSGYEVGGSAVPYGVGTEAVIVDHVKLDDGGFNLIVQGRRRFRVMRLDYSRPQLWGAVEWFSEDEAEPVRPEVKMKAIALIAAHLRYLRSLFLPDLKIEIGAEDPAKLSYQIGQLLQTADEEKQNILEIGSTEERLQKEIEILLRTLPVDGR